ncbi:MAG TPA: rhodanese-like domain-containing protein [Flavobacteriales bacterium]|nr:rhodanese-like domain-containing protein [Flavobacteriales bacterium]
MKVRTILLLGVMVPGVPSSAQYDGDNTRYRTISWEEFPADLAKSTKALILDVRSPGEYSDTSHWASRNIGRLKGALNIDHREVDRRLNELPERDRPIYLYCSHSQRSRRVSNMLVDSGYTNVININGGMSRYWNERDRLPGMDGLIERSAGYDIINAQGLCEMRSSHPVFLLDVRADSLVLPDGKRPEWVSAYGAIKESTHIPVERLKESAARIPRDWSVVVVGAYTADAAIAASELIALGFKDVSVLFKGLEGMIDVSDERCSCRKEIWSSEAPYSAIGLDQLDTLALLSGRQVMLDIRSQEEFDGTAKDTWKNVGRFRLAKHIPAGNVRERISEMGISKSTPVVLIGRTLDEELFDMARTLTDLGYAQVSLLTCGSWGVRWEAHNLPGHAAWDAWMTKYPNTTPTNP